MGKTALIIGATGGIGKAISIILAKNGYNIGIHYDSNKEKALEIEKEIKKFEVKTFIIKGDVADESIMNQQITKLQSELGTLDVIINTAGIMRLSPIRDLNMDEFDQVMRTNVRGTFVISKIATKCLNSDGVLINFSTSVTRTHFENYGVYASAKSAIETLTPILAKELRGKNIRVNTIAPGPIATPLFLDGKSEDLIQKISLSNPLERLGTPDDIATAVKSIIESDWINAQTIFVNGGMI